MKIAVLLHGSGVYDGTEIQEAVLTYLSIAKAGHTYESIAPDWSQHHVINHLNGEEMPETRNVLVESARIARGKIVPLSEAQASNYDALVMPGGFGTAKNFTQWAFDGPNGSIQPAIRDFLLDFVRRGIPIAALCMSPTTLAKALEASDYAPLLSVGTSEESSPYDISAISAGMERTGAKIAMKSVREVAIDPRMKIVCAPCYMMDADIAEVHQNIEQAIAALIQLAQEKA